MSKEKERKKLQFSYLMPQSPRKSFSTPRINPQNSMGFDSYVQQLDDLLKKNTGQSTLVGQNVEGAPASYIPGRVSNPTGLGETPQSVMNSAVNTNYPFPVQRNIEDLSKGYYGGSDQGMGSQDFFGMIHEQQNAPEDLYRGVGAGITDPNGRAAQVGSSYGIPYQVTTLSDGGRLGSDGIVRYDDGTVREGVRSSGGYGIASLPDGSVRYSDGTVRRQATPQEKQMVQQGSYGVASLPGGYVRQNDNTIRTAFGFEGQGIPGYSSLPPDYSGVSGLSKSLFGGRDQVVTQPYGNYNPQVEVTKSGINYGTDFRTRDLPADARSLSLPFQTRVLEAKTGYNQGYGNTALLELPNGETLRVSHLSDLHVRPGQVLSAGQSIGTPGSSGNTYGEHLDVEYRDTQGRPKNPSTFNVRSITGNTQGTYVTPTTSISGIDADKQDAANKLIQAFRDVGITDPKVVAYGLATALGESGLRPVNEAYFVDERNGLPPGTAGRQEASRRGYSGGSEYFGRGYIQLTHDYNYKKYGDMLGIDLVNHPELANDPEIAAKVMALYFKEAGVDRAVQRGDLTAARRAVNGGTNNIQGINQAFSQLVPGVEQVLASEQRPSPFGQGGLIASYPSSSMRTGSSEGMQSGSTRGAFSLPSIIRPVQAFEGMNGQSRPPSIQQQMGSILSNALSDENMGRTVENFGTLLKAPELQTRELSSLQGTNPFRQLAGNVLDTASTPLKKLGLPDLGISEAIAGGRTTNTNLGLAPQASAFGEGVQAISKPKTPNQYAEVLGQNVMEAAKYALPGLGSAVASAIPGLSSGINALKGIGNVFGKKESPKNEFVDGVYQSRNPDPLSSAGQGISSLASGSTSDLSNIFKPKQENQKRAVGDVQGTTDQEGNLQFSSLMDTAQSRSGLPKNDVRDPFFKMGGMETYKSFLKPNADQLYGGALKLDLFNNAFFEDPGNIASVFGGTQFQKEATDRFLTQQKAKTPYLSTMGYSDEFDRGAVDDYNRQVNDYNNSLNNYYNSITSYIAGTPSIYATPPKATNKNIFSSPAPYSSPSGVSAPTVSISSPLGRPTSSSVASLYSVPVNIFRPASIPQSTKSVFASAPGPAAISRPTAAPKSAPAPSSSPSAPRSTPSPTQQAAAQIRSSPAIASKPAPAPAPKSTPKPAPAPAPKSVYTPPKSTPSPTQQAAAQIRNSTAIKSTPKKK